MLAAPSLGGQGIFDYVTNKASPDFAMWDQLIVQATAVGITLVWSAIVAAVSYFIVNLVIGLRVTEEEEREGLDISSHGESAYHP